MIEVPLVTIEETAYACGDGVKDLWTMTREAISALRPSEIGGVIAATFSNPVRFPSLAIRVATELDLPHSTPAFDVQMACSAYPYALYLAGRLAADTGKRILVVDGDCQMPFVDSADPATGAIFSDAATASVVTAAPSGRGSKFDFLSVYDEAALSCVAQGPIRMDGMKVFTFVATRVREFLRDFIAHIAESTSAGFAFVPHQAQPYMIRQLAKALNLESSLVTLDESFKNPGSASIPLTIATRSIHGRVLLAGFGAGYSAGVGIVEVK